jgi:hypothetical protein
MKIQPNAQTMLVHSQSIRSNSLSPTESVPQNKDTFTPSPELRIKQTLEAGNYDFNDISLDEMRKLSDQLFEEGLISPIAQMLMNTPANWEISSNNGTTASVTNGDPNEKLDYLAYWNQMQTIGTQDEKNTATKIYDFLKGLQELASA